MGISRSELERRVLLSAGEYGISAALFRNAIGNRLSVNAADMAVLTLLFFKGYTTPTELSAYTGLSSGATSAMLDRLEKRGLLRRSPNPADRRGTLVTRGVHTAEAVEPLFASVRRGQSKLVASYSGAELRLLADFFKRFATIWDQGHENL